jgi:hypothetical protein
MGPPPATPTGIAATLPLIAAASAAMAGGLAAFGMIRVRGSTAVPAAAWSVAACLALAAEMAMRSAGGLADPAAAAAARLAVVAVAVCPAMSLLGAKRPQHGVWQFIVATLAFVLVMPAISARLMRPGSLPDVHLIGRFFMPVLVLVGWLNFAGTRRVLPASCVAIGQILLMRGFLPGARPDAAGGMGLDALAAVLFAAGALLATIQTLAAAGRPAPPAAGPLAAAIDPAFVALRDTLGAAWALRLAEAFNALATTRGWPCRLRFGGIDETSDVSGGEPRCGTSCETTAWHADAVHAFRALARRFVDDGWLSRHGWRETRNGGPRDDLAAS